MPKMIGSGDRAPRPRNQALEMQIGQAVRARSLIRFTYDGVTRTVAPHVVHKPKARILVEGDELSTSKRPAGKIEWRAYEIALVSALELVGEGFQPNPKFSSFDERYREVQAAVDRVA